MWATRLGKDPSPKLIKKMDRNLGPTSRAPSPSSAGSILSTSRGIMTDPFLSIKTPSQTVQASSKAYGFLDVNDDIYTDGSSISYNEVPHEWIYRNQNPPNHSCYDLLHPRSSRSVIWLMFFM